MGKRVIAAAALGVALAVVGVASAAGASTVVSAKLTPTAETGKGLAGGSGTAVITLNVKTRKACWKLSVKGIDKPLSAHVHQAAKGKDGPVVIPLGARFATTGCVVVPLQKKTKANPHPVDVLAAVSKNPSSYYVNVHTKKYLNGAIRGQLKLGR